MTGQCKVGYIIPAFNEAPRLSAVVKVLRALPEHIRPEDRNILVVDDYSKDDTVKVARSLGVRVEPLGINWGKGSAMLAGFDLMYCNHEFICFLDADLTHLDPHDLASLIEPVLTGEVLATIGVFADGPVVTTMAQKLAPSLSGQRCISTKLLHVLEREDWKRRFGIEVALNAFLEGMGVESRVVRLYGASQVMKEQKRGWLAGAISRVGMYNDILATWRSRKDIVMYYQKKRAGLPEDFC